MTTILSIYIPMLPTFAGWSIAAGRVESIVQVAKRNRHQPQGCFPMTD